MDMTLFLKILAVIIFLLGGAMFYTANVWVKKFNLADKMKVPNEEEYTEEDLQKYKQMKAQLQVKIMSLALLLPGIILILIVFR